MLNKLLLTALGTALTLSCVAQEVNTQSALTDVNKSILVKPDQKDMTIRLKSNMTTGYSWLLKSYDHHLLRLESHQYVAPNTKLVGAPGIEEWHFKISAEASKASQISQVVLVNARPWDLKDAKETTITWISQGR